MTTTDMTNRATTISLRLAPSEFAELKRMADAAGSTVSGFIRSKLFKTEETGAATPSTNGQRNHWQAASYGQDARLATPVGSTFSSSFSETRGVVSFGHASSVNNQGLVH